MEQANKLYRSRTDKIFTGVCGGLGAYFDVEPLIFRAVFLILMFAGGSGLLLYIVLTIIIPQEPGEAVHVDRKEKMHEFAQSVAGHAKTFVEEVRISEPDRRKRAESRRNAIAAVVIVLGVILLLNQIFPFSWLRWNFFWPTLLIIVGVALLARSGKE